MSKPIVIILLTLSVVFPFSGQDLYAEEVCSQEKVDKMAALGLTKEQIFTVCPQIECSAERVANLKDAGLDDCEIDQLCPGHFQKRTSELKTAGLSEAEIAALFPKCFSPEEQPGSAETVTKQSPSEVSPPQGEVALDHSDPRVKISQTSCDNCSKSEGRLDLEIVPGDENEVKAAVSTVLKGVTGSWYSVKVLVDDEKIGEDKAIGAQSVEMSKHIPVGKHEVTVQFKDYGLLILPSAQREHKATIDIHEGKTSKVKILMSKRFSEKTAEEN